MKFMILCSNNINFLMKYYKNQSVIKKLTGFLPKLTNILFIAALYAETMK